MIISVEYSKGVSEKTTIQLLKKSAIKANFLINIK